MTYIPQLLIQSHQLCCVPRVRPATREDLVAHSNPSQGRLHPIVDLLRPVPASERVEKDSMSEGGKKVCWSARADRSQNIRRFLLCFGKKFQKES